MYIKTLQILFSHFFEDGMNEVMKTLLCKLNLKKTRRFLKYEITPYKTQTVILLPQQRPEKDTIREWVT